MTKREQGRINLLNVIKNDTNLITVGEITEIFCGTIKLCDERTETFKKIKERLSEEEYISLITGLANSFLSSLYVSASYTEEELAERTKLVTTTNSDIMKGVAVGSHKMDA